MELIKGGGEQTPQNEQTSETDMISRQRRDDLTRAGKFGRGADCICASTLGYVQLLGWSRGAVSQKPRGARRLLDKLITPSAQSLAHLG